MRHLLHKRREDNEQKISQPAIDGALTVDVSQFPSALHRNYLFDIVNFVVGECARLKRASAVSLDVSQMLID